MFSFYWYNLRSFIFLICSSVQVCKMVFWLLRARRSRAISFFFSFVVGKWWFSFFGGRSNICCQVLKMDNDQPRNIQSAPPTRQTTTKASTKRRAAPKNEFDNFHSISSLAKGPSSSRLFSPLEAEMWTCTTAANFAAGHYVPMCRRLGIITRTLKGTIPSSKAKRKKVDACGNNMYTKVTIPSLA